MPFTTSHPAIVLPLKQIWPRWFSLSGLMAGAMAPDLLYFLMMGTTERSFSHSWPGLFVFCIPAGVLFAFAFHWYFKRSFLTGLPSPLDRYFSGLTASEFRVTTGRGWGVLIGSVLVGALSHFFWDSWTHAHGAIASRIPFLLSYTYVFGRPIQITSILQHLSTLTGAAVILWYLMTGRLIPGGLESYQPISARAKRIYWIAALSGSVIAVIIAMKIWCGGIGFWTLEHADRGTLFRAIGLGSWAGFFWATCLFRLWRRPTGVSYLTTDRYEGILKR